MPFISKQFLARLLLGGVVLGAAISGANDASALPGGPWASSSSPLKVNYAGWKPVGYVYGKWQGYREDQGRGSRVQDWSAGKTRNTYNRGVYTRHNWYWNGSYCYVSSFSDSGGGVSCASGWHADGATNSKSNNTKSWKYYETWYSADPQADSARGKMRACFNVKYSPDPCSSAYFLRGAKY